MKSERNIYLDMKPPDQAVDIILKHFASLSCKDTDTIETVKSMGRVLAEPVYAAMSSPAFHAAAMDGIAVKAKSTFMASGTKPIKLHLGTEAVFLNTGNIIPEGFNSVIMIEHVNIEGDYVFIETPAFPWQHIRKAGEDIVAKELIFTQNHKITPYCIGAILCAGVFFVKVRKKPKILIIPTGSELTKWENAKTLMPGKIVETNSFVLGSLAEKYGGQWTRHDIVEDKPEKIISAIQTGIKDGFDMIFTVGGSSAGTFDYSKKVIETVGKILIHGVTIMPGKPLIAGDVSGKPIFGIPGYPVSAIVAFEHFVGPLILKMLGLPDKRRAQTKVIPAKKIASKLGIEDLVRVQLGRVGDKVTAAPMKRGAGSITSLTKAHGIIRIPKDSEGVDAGKPVLAELLCDKALIDKTIFIVGSHDNTIDIISDHMRAVNRDITLSSSNVGSLGGLMAIKKGVCHAAGTHLLDTKDGTYNVSYIKKHLKQIKVKLVNLVMRKQGLIVAKGNPKNIKGIEDLRKVTIINRQPGSGTRILLDYELSRLNIDTKEILGYDNEEFTHMSVAAAVASNAADAGPAIFAAAKALDLDFIPLVTEQYDLVIPNEFFESKRIKVMLEAINSSSFKKRVESLGGYSTHKTGEIVEIG